MAEKTPAADAAKTETTAGTQPASPAPTDAPRAVTLRGLVEQYGEAGEKAYHDIAAAGGYGDMRLLAHSPDLDLTGLSDEIPKREVTKFGVTNSEPIPGAISPRAAVNKILAGLK